MNPGINVVRNSKKRSGQWVIKKAIGEDVGRFSIIGSVRDRSQTNLNSIANPKRLEGASADPTVLTRSKSPRVRWGINKVDHSTTAFRWLQLVHFRNRAVVGGEGNEAVVWCAQATSFTHFLWCTVERGGVESLFFCRRYPLSDFFITFRVQEGTFPFAFLGFTFSKRNFREYLPT